MNEDFELEFSWYVMILIIIMAMLAGLSHAQTTNTFPALVHFPGVPTNPCVLTTFAQNDSNSNLYLCSTGLTWVQIGASSSFSTVGQAGFYGAGFFNNPLSVFSSTSGLNSVNNEVRVAQFQLTFSQTVGHCTFNITGGANGTLGSFGIYNAAGTTKLVDCGVFTVSGTGVQSKSITPVVLPGGATYVYAQTSNSSANLTGPSIANMSNNILQVANSNGVRIGTSANPSVSGVLPATLGTLTLDNTTSTFIAGVLFEP